MIHFIGLQRSFFTIAFFYIVFIKADAQLWRMRRVEASFGLGTSYFFSDIGGYPSLDFKDLYENQTKYNINLSLKYRITGVFTSRFSFTIGQLSGDDAVGSNISRGYKCLVTTFEPALMGEFYILRNRSEKSFFYPMQNERTIVKVLRVLDVYTFAGLGMLGYKIGGNDRLEAVMQKPNGCALVFPAGAGTSLVFSPDLSMGIELGGRFAFSDKIDGFTSPYSHSNDIYYYLNIFIIFKKRSASSFANNR